MKGCKMEIKNRKKFCSGFRFWVETNGDIVKKGLEDRRRKSEVRNQDIQKE
jgi:GH24 family phage-related lysozyme (muramidase)